MRNNTRSSCYKLYNCIHSHSKLHILSLDDPKTHLHEKVNETLCPFPEIQWLFELFIVSRRPEQHCYFEIDES